MRRREFLALAGGAAAAWPLAARARTSGRVARVGFLTPTGRVPVIDAFALKLRDLGWIEGQNLHVELRFAENDESRLPALASELVGLDPDVIVTVGPAVLAAHLATSVLPIVVAGAADLVAYGMVESLAHPGGNITGELVFLPQYVAKRLEFLKGVAPSLTRMGVLLYRASPVNAEMMRVATSAARALRVELSPIELGEVGEFESAFPPSSPIGGFVTTDHPLFAFNAAALAGIALKRGLPWVGAVDEAAAGALLSYGADFREVIRHAAVFVDKILRGATPGDIPIEQVTKFRMIANLKTAAALGLEIPPTILAAADEVIE